MPAQPLDDMNFVTAIDTQDMLGSTWSAGEQIRYGLKTLNRDYLRSLSTLHPRSVYITGMGGSGISGQVLAALARTSSGIPVFAHSGYELPSWVGSDDVVIALSASGKTEETISAARMAAEKGATLIAITSEGTPLADVAHSAGTGPVFIVDTFGRMPRASMWTLLTPLLLIADSLKIVTMTDAALQAAADIADTVARTNGPAVPWRDNFAKQLGYSWATSAPIIWGSGELGGIFAYRAMCQVAENAKIALVHGEVPEAQHNQVVALDSPFTLTAPPTAAHRHLFMLEDATCHPQVRKRIDIAQDIAASRDIPVTRVSAPDGPAISRLAWMCAFIDFASVYAALALGADPSPIAPINELKDRLAD